MSEETNDDESVYLDGLPIVISNATANGRGVIYWRREGCPEFVKDNELAVKAVHVTAKRLGVAVNEASMIEILQHPRFLLNYLYYANAPVLRDGKS